jgi:hypothetical protein
MREALGSARGDTMTGDQAWTEEELFWTYRRMLDEDA